MNPELHFEWDSAKAKANFSKHSVSFEEAQMVFRHPLAFIFSDEEHSTEDEEREIIIGYSAHNRIILVAFTERATGIRLINARRATPKERKDYEEYIFGTGR